MATNHLTPYVDGPYYKVFCDAKLLAAPPGIEPRPPPMTSHHTDRYTMESDIDMKRLTRVLN